ncbi:MAG: globin [Pseudomonadales bacterium]|nr:globin [Pseudomonadales bacterium]
MSDFEIISSTFEYLAHKNIDISEATFKLFFEACPEAEDLMGHTDHLMRGRMLEALTMMMVMPEGASKTDLVLFEVNTHATYDVEAFMYLRLLEAFYHAIKHAMQSDWTPPQEGAWQREIKRLIDIISVGSQTI